MIIDFKAYSEIICEPNSMLILRNMKTSIIFNESHKLHCVRGQSGFFNLALTEGNMQVKFDLKLTVY